jgi:large subunit ribosomal protein L15
MQIHELQRINKNKKARQIGRGGTRGKTSGRGHKGQSARAGNKKRPEIRDMIKKIPKLRGYNFNSIQEDAVPVNVSVLELLYNVGETVSPKTLVLKGVSKKRGDKYPPMKILGSGDLKKKLTVEGCRVSKTAQEKIEKAGGKIR